jgi:hypothetical protein
MWSLSKFSQYPTKVDCNATWCMTNVNLLWISITEQEVIVICQRKLTSIDCTGHNKPLYQ